MSQLATQLRRSKPPREVYPPKPLSCKLRGMVNYHWVMDTLGVSDLTAQRILAGIDLKLTHALKISRALGVSIQDLWEVKL
jgi:hypothetical protein